MNKIIRNLLLFILFFGSIISATKAEDELSNAEKIITNQDENNYTREFIKKPPQPIRQYIYEPATLKTLAYLHWAISILDINDNNNIDNFLKITECGIYKTYSTDEFEWKKIRQATREYIKKNLLDFPLRFELVIPLKLGEYITDNSYFELNKEDIIKSIRLFELYASDYKPYDICGDTTRFVGNFYKALLIELSRPFSLVHVPVEKEKAEKLIENANKIYQERLSRSSEARFVQRELYDLREAYLVLYLKIFTYKGPYVNQNDQDYIRFGQVLGVLEGYEIFGDRERRNLFYSRNYITKRNVQKESETLEREIDVLKKRHKEKGMLF